MEKQQIVNESPEAKENVETVTTKAALDEIQKLKENTVPKEDYQRLAEDNKLLLEKVVNGQSVSSVPQEEPVDLDALRNELFNNPDLTNLQFCEKMLKVRKEVMRRTGQDPFVPKTHGGVPTSYDVDCANKLADAIENCIEYAQGDSAIFTQEMQRIIANDPIRIRR